MFVPQLHIIVTTQEGKTIEFFSANDVHIKKSIHSAVVIGNLRIPTSAVLRKVTETVTTSVETAKQFKAGDKIEIKLGYDGVLNTEFKGFIRRVNFTTPCQLECEGYSYQLKRTSEFFKQWKNTTVKDVLNTLISGTDILIHKDTVDAQIDHLEIVGKNALEAIEKLKEQTGFVAFFINHNELYVGLKYLALRSEEVKYRIGWNTIKDGELKYRSKEDQKCFYNVNYRDAKGKEHHFSFGTKGGETFNCSLGYVPDRDVAKTKAAVMSSNDIYEGYEGALTAFLIPYCEPSYIGVVIDDNYPERNGAFIVTGTEIRLNKNGGRRIATIGPSINFLQTNKV